MDRRYTILAILLIVAAFGLVILPGGNNSKELTPKELLLSINEQARFVSTDQVTERIIERDPSLQLIDVRPASEFVIFALPGAINIPLDSIASPNFREVLSLGSKDKVFYSNGDIEADLAWQICARDKFKRVFVMKGGLNYWYETIIKGVEPPSTASSDALELYQFRLAAKQFFVGNGSGTQESASKDAKPKAETIKVEKKHSSGTGGGC